MQKHVLRARLEKALPLTVTTLFITASLLALFVPPARGQTQLPPITVTGSDQGAEAGPGAISPPPAEVARERLDKVPGGVSLVPESELRETRAANVKDVLDYVPGVFVANKYGQGDSRVDIRGSSLSRNVHQRGVKLLFDGVPINRPDGGPSDAQEVDPLAYSYAEVYKGANALQYGAALLGGAVNFVSPTGYSNPGYLLRQEFGTEQTFRSQFAAGGVSGKADYYITPTWSYTDGYRSHTDGNIKRVSGNFGYRFMDGVENRFYLQAADIFQKHPSGLTKSQALSNPDFTAGQNIAGNTLRNVESVRLADKLTFLTDSGEGMVGAYTTSKELFHIFSLTTPGSVVVDHERQVGGFARYKQDWQLAGFKNETLVGLNIVNGYVHAKRFNDNKGAPGAMTNNTEEKTNTVELYGEEQFYVLPAVALVGGLQASFNERNLEDKFLTDGNDSGSRDYYALNPKLGMRWDVAPQWQVFGNLSWAEEAPAFSELNPNSTPGFVTLAPQKSRTLEVGTRYRSKDYALELSLYRADLQDEIQLVDIGNSLNQSRNIPKSLHQGIELGGEATLARQAFMPNDRLSMRGAYNYNDFRFVDDPTFRNNELPGEPTHFVRLELRYDSSPTGQDGSWFLAPNVEWIPQGYFVDNINSQTVPAYAIWGLRGGYSLGQGLRVFAEARNILDKHYIASASVATSANSASTLFNPGEGRMLYAGLEWRF